MRSTWTPAFFAINAYQVRSNIGFASAAAVIMLVMTLAIFLPLLVLCVGVAAGVAAHVDRGEIESSREDELHLDLDLQLTLGLLAHDVDQWVLRHRGPDAPEPPP